MRRGDDMPDAEETARIHRLAKDIGGNLNLAIHRKPETHHFQMQTEFVHLGFNGKRTATERYGVTLRCDPAVAVKHRLDHYTCGGFCVQLDADTVVTIPALDNWAYDFDPMSGADGQGPVFGVPHDRFEGLTDSGGREFPPDIRYAIYNNFIDFHALNDVFSRPLQGRGVEQLHRVGDRVVHPAAFVEAPVNLGSAVKPGSVYRNGEVTLELKGISIVDGAVCALIEYDSGESTLMMHMASASGPDTWIEGGSEYKGDIYLDLETGWVRKVTLDEFVETETVVADSTAKVNACVVRHLWLRLIGKEAFEREPARTNLRPR